jgi:S1-C subfamily serine protease
MKVVASLLLAAALMAVTSVANATDPLVQHLQDVSVTIKAGDSQGSGVLFTRKVGDDHVTYVWTAAHVVDGLRKVRTVIVNGNPKAVVEFQDAQIVQEFRQAGRRIGEVKMDARVVRYSDARQGHDLALLEVRKRNFTEATIKFHTGDDIPALGTELYHVGSLLGQFGSNSLTTGVVSQIGRVLDLGANGTVFDQTTVTAFPGSSGGGVFLKEDGQYVGMLVRGAGEQFNLIVPIRRLRDWAKEAKIEWAVDPNLPMPSPEELKKLPVEDAGVQFYGAEKAAATKDFPYLLKLPEAEPTPAASPSVLVK